MVVSMSRLQQSSFVVICASTLIIGLHLSYLIIAPKVVLVVAAIAVAISAAYFIESIVGLKNLIRTQFENNLLCQGEEQTIQKEIIPPSPVLSPPSSPDLLRSVAAGAFLDRGVLNILPAPPPPPPDLLRSKAVAPPEKEAKSATISCSGSASIAKNFDTSNSKKGVKLLTVPGGSFMFELEKHIKNPELRRVEPKLNMSKEPIPLARHKILNNKPNDTNNNDNKNGHDFTAEEWNEGWQPQKTTRSPQHINKDWNKEGQKTLSDGLNLHKKTTSDELLQSNPHANLLQDILKTQLKKRREQLSPSSESEDEGLSSNYSSSDDQENLCSQKSSSLHPFPAPLSNCGNPLRQPLKAIENRPTHAIKSTVQKPSTRVAIHKVISQAPPELKDSSMLSFAEKRLKFATLLCKK